MSTTRTETLKIIQRKTWLLVRSQKIGQKISARETAKRQCTHEIKALIHRWEQESDLDSEELVDCLMDGVNEYYEQDICFESEIDLDDEVDGELDLGEA